MSRQAPARSVLVDRPSKFDYSRVTVTFESGGDACTGWLYRPDRPTTAPVVVMVGGLALPRETLRPLAEQFAARGYAVFLFDPRGIGDSEGTPRNLVSPARTQTDLEAAVARVRELDDVDANRLVLWGHSLGGAAALAVAGEDPRVRGVVAVAPVLSGRTVLRARPVPAVVRALAAGVRDRIQGIVPRVGPHTVPAAGDDDELAIVSDTSVRGAYRRLTDVPDVPARSFLALARATTDLAGLSCPALLVGGSHDDVAPAADVEAASADHPEATFIRLPATHLGVLDDDQALQHALVFLDAHLG